MARISDLQTHTHMPDPNLSDAEWRIMNAVWRCTEPVSARRVLEEVEAATGWAYTTVKTMMDRLVDKGALEGRRVGNAIAYTARLSRAKARGDAARSLVTKAFDGSVGPLVQYLVTAEELSDEEREELRAMLERQQDGGTS